MAWLAEFYHVPLDSSPFTAQQRKEWRSRRSQAEAKVKKVAAWRDRRLLEMRDRRNGLWDQDRRLVCNWARWASQAGSGTEADWEFAWDCIAESLQANDIDAEMQKIEAHSDAKLIRHFIDMDPPPLKSAVATDSPEGARR